MANFRIIFLAFARHIAQFAIQIFRTFSIRADGSLPAVGANAFAIGWIALGAIFAAARFRAILTVRVTRTVIVAFVSGETGRAFTFASHVVAIGAVIALARLLTLLAKESGLASIGAHITSPT